ncbi:MAG: integrase core domain-containing protein [Bdellovibrionales bacterium]
MRRNDKDDTLKRNYIQKYQYLIIDYEQVKRKEHPQYRTAKAFYAAHGTCAQTFLKCYNRFRASGSAEAALLPGKRGPKYKTRRCPQEIEDLVLAERKKGCNRYEIHSILKPMLKERTPAPSTIYQVFKRHGQNRISPPMQEEKKRYVREKAGALAHIDCCHLGKDMIADDSRRYYLLALIDDATRIAWAEVMTDATALSALFATIKCLNEINNRYAIKFAEALTDNGPEFGPRGSSQKAGHPFERLLVEMGIKHLYTKPYRPQTNGKVERFWRTLNEDLIDGTHFASLQGFKDELFAYLLYYNQLRPHQALAGLPPADHANSCQRIA